MTATREVLRALSTLPKATTTDLVEETGLTFDEVYDALFNLRKTGRIRSVPVSYEITEAGMKALEHQPPGKHLVRRPRHCNESRMPKENALFTVWGGK